MKMIRAHHLCTNTSAKDFSDDLAIAIEKCQNRGLEVDIKYQTTMCGYEVVYSALILAYEEV